MLDFKWLVLTVFAKDDWLASMDVSQYCMAGHPEK